MIFLQATFEGWMEVMEDAVDSTEVGKVTFYLECLLAVHQVCGLLVMTDHHSTSGILNFQCSPKKILLPPSPIQVINNKRSLWHFLQFFFQLKAIIVGKVFHQYLILIFFIKLV